MKVKRRDFLKVCAATGTVAMMNTPVLNAFAEEVKKRSFGESSGEWKPTTCQGCTSWCAVEVFVQDGRAVKVKGNRYSKQHGGVICPKGHLSLQQLYDPDRVKVPMKRTNKKKGRGIDPKFVPISWDEALNTIADKVMELRNNGEPEKFMLMRGRYTYMRDIIYDAFPKIFGTPNNISHSAICAEAEKFGPYFTEGFWDYRDYDLDKTKYLLIWGCDPLSSNRQIPATISKFGDLLDRATVAVVDPKFNSSAAKAQEWLPILTGTDGALAGAIAHVLLVEGLWGKEFVGDFKDGINLFKAGETVDASLFNEKESNGIISWWNLELKDRTPKWAADITQIPEEQILRVAQGLGKAAPRACVWMGPGAAMHVRGSYSSMAVHALNGLLGAVDNEGGSNQGTKVPVNKIPLLDTKFEAYQDELSKKQVKMKKIDQRGYKQFPALKDGKPGGGVVTNNAAQGMLDKDPYEIKVAIAYMNNFVFSCTGAERWEKAMEELPFFAHLTTHASEMTQYADIVLPCATTKYEKLGYVKTLANGYSVCSLVQPVVKPLWDVMEDESEIPWELSIKLKERGFPNLHDYFQKEFKDPETGKMPKTAAEFTEFNLKAQTAPLWDGKKDVGGDKINGWKEFRERGVWNSGHVKYKAHWGGKFKTKTGKFEFYSETLKEALAGHAEKHKTTVDDILETCKYTARGELAFVPHYEPPYRLGDKEKYPFTFIDYKSKLNREGRSQNNPWYYEFKHLDVGDVGWDDVVKINPLDAQKLGIKDGDKVRITSTISSITCLAKLWEGVRPGEVAKCYGQGHWAYGRVAAADYAKAQPRGGNNNYLIPAEYDRLSGSTARNGGFVGVKIEKI